MAITTLDGIIAGAQPPRSILKAGATMEAVGVPHTFWYTAGIPGAASANAAGVNGAAVSATQTGQIPRSNPGAGSAYIAHLSATANVAGTLILIDRLWHNSGLSTTSTTAQAISPATLPARDVNASSNGEGVEAAVEWSAAGGAGTPTVTLTYTDADGNTGATGTFVGQATPAAGTFEIFALAAGDTGVRAPTSFIQSATRTSGTQHLVLFRRLAQVSVNGAGMGMVLDAISGVRVEVPDDAVLQLLWIPSATTAVNLQGMYVEAHG